MQKNSHAHVKSFSRAQKSFLRACKSLFFLLLLFFILGTVYVVTSRKSMEKKTPEKLKIFTDDYYIPNIKLKMLTIYVKYGLKIYREVWKFESGKVWNFEMEKV